MPTEFPAHNQLQSCNIGTADSAEMMCHRSDELSKELAAVAAGCGVHGDLGQSALSRRGRIGDKELLRMDRVVQRQVGELQIHANIDSARHSQSDCPAPHLSKLCKCNSILLFGSCTRVQS